MTLRSNSMMVALLTWLSLGTSALAGDKIVLGVELMESRGSPLKADEVVSLTDLLGAGLGESGQLQIVPRQDLRARMSGELPEGAGPLASAELDYLIAARIARVGTRCLLLAEIRAAADGMVVGAETMERACEPADLVAGVEALAARLRADFSLSPQGERKLRLAPADAPLLSVPMMESRGARVTADEVVALTGLLALRIQSATRLRLYKRGAGKGAEALAEKRRKGIHYALNSCVTRVGKVCLMTASLWDGAAGATVKAASVRSKCEAEALREATEQIADKMAAAIRAQVQGGSKK